MYVVRVINLAIDFILLLARSKHCQTFTIYVECIIPKWVNNGRNVMNSHKCLERKKKHENWFISSCAWKSAPSSSKLGLNENENRCHTNDTNVRRTATITLIFKVDKSNPTEPTMIPTMQTSILTIRQWLVYWLFYAN